MLPNSETVSRMMNEHWCCTMSMSLTMRFHPQRTLLPPLGLWFQHSLHFHLILEFTLNPFYKSVSKCWTCPLVSDVFLAPYARRSRPVWHWFGDISVKTYRNNCGESCLILNWWVSEGAGFATSSWIKQWITLMSCWIASTSELTLVLDINVRKCLVNVCCHCTICIFGCSLGPAAVESCRVC